MAVSYSVKCYTISRNLSIYDRRAVMGKDTRLVNIYLKIHHKQPLTMDDLAYLAEYAPECFEKTCKNVVYNIPIFSFKEKC